MNKINEFLDQFIDEDGESLIYIPRKDGEEYADLLEQEEIDLYFEHITNHQDAGDFMIDIFNASSAEQIERIRNQWRSEIFMVKLIKDAQERLENSIDSYENVESVDFEKQAVRGLKREFCHG